MTHAQVFTLADLAIDRPMPKLERQRVMGEKMMISRVVLEEGFVLATHSHENEQFVVMVSGRCIFTIGQVDGSDAMRDVELRAGQVLVLPSLVPHGVRALTRCEILDVFSPVSAMTGVDGTPPGPRR